MAPRSKVSLEQEIADLNTLLAEAKASARVEAGRYAEVVKDNDALRDELMRKSLEAERLRGYLEGLEDSKPPVMVPLPRERAPDEGVNFASLRGPGQRRWYHRRG